MCSYVKKINKKSESAKKKFVGQYWVVNEQCLGCKCFAPGDFEIRGATSVGSRSTGNTKKCCLTNAYRGCPEEEDKGYSDELLKERKKEGWKISQ